MHKDAESWEMTLAKCGILQRSTVEESDNGYVYVTIIASTSTTPDDSDESSEDLAVEIFSGVEVSEVYIDHHFDGGGEYIGTGATFVSLYDKCVIQFQDPELYDAFEPNKESARLDGEFGEIDWGWGEPLIHLFSLIKEAADTAGSSLANTLLLSGTSEVYLQRIYKPEECRKLLPQRRENSDYELWDNANPAWALMARHTGREG